MVWVGCQAKERKILRATPRFLAQTIRWLKILLAVMIRLREKQVWKGIKFHLGPSKCGILVRYIYISEYVSKR